MRRVAVGYRTIGYLRRVFNMAFKAQNERGPASRLRAIRIALLATMLICSGLHPSRAADGDLDRAASGDNDLVLARYNTEPDFSLSLSSSAEVMSPRTKAKVTL